MPNETEARNARLGALNRMQHAGFGIRLFAHWIDAILIGIVKNLIFLPIGFVAGIKVGLKSTDPAAVKGSLEALENSLPLAGLSILTFYVLFVIYHTYFISKRDGATLGKQICHLKVISLNTVRYPNPSEALKRALFQIVSLVIFCIGYLMIAFRKDKRGLHDLAANTVVVKFPKK